MVGQTVEYMVVQTPEIKLRDLGYFEFYLKMMSIAKNDAKI